MLPTISIIIVLTMTALLDASIYRPAGRAYFRFFIYRITIVDGDGLYREMFDACHAHRHGWFGSKCNINVRICVGVLGDYDLAQNLTSRDNVCSGASRYNQTSAPHRHYREDSYQFFDLTFEAKSTHDKEIYLFANNLIDRDISPHNNPMHGSNVTSTLQMIIVDYNPTDRLIMHAEIDFERTLDGDNEQVIRHEVFAWYPEIHRLSDYPIDDQKPDRVEMKRGIWKEQDTNSSRYQSTINSTVHLVMYPSLVCASGFHGCGCNVVCVDRYNYECDLQTGSRICHRHYYTPSNAIGRNVCSRYCRMREEEDGTVVGGGYCDEYGKPMCTDTGFAAKLDGQDSEDHNIYKCVVG